MISLRGMGFTWNDGRIMEVIVIADEPKVVVIADEPKRSW